VTVPARLGEVYGRIWSTYRAWWRPLLLLALIVFLPLALLDALTLEAELTSLDSLGRLEVLAMVTLVVALGATGLLGEVFYSGAIALSLTQPRDRPPPSLREIAGRLRFGRLIVVDLVFVGLVALGLLAAVVPGVLAFVWLGLAGPLVEIEGRRPFDALRRSVQLVRGSFWLVFWVLVPIELVGDGISTGLTTLVHDLLGDSLVAVWLTEAAAEIVLSPVFAVAAVLLATDMIAADGGPAAGLRPAPVPA
jgi:hypothetical protein